MAIILTGKIPPEHIDGLEEYIEEQIEEEVSQKSEVNINASVNSLVDKFEVALNKSVEWWVYIEDPTLKKYLQYKLVVAHVDATNPDYQTWDIVGPEIPHVINITFDGTYINLYVQNNEIHTITCKVVRNFI